MKKHLFLFVFVSFLILSCKEPFAPDMTLNVPCVDVPNNNPAHPKAAVFQGIIDKYIKKGIPGISMLIRDKDNVWVGAGGQADIKNNVPMTPCTVSKVASVTKMFVGMLTLKLVEEGKLNLDTKISQYLSNSVIKKIENADKVTLRMCLSHTTGIYDVIKSNSFYLSVVNNPTKEWTAEELIEFVYNKPAVFTDSIGVRAKYSNTNTLIVALIINQVTGENFQKLIQERVVMPLGLTQTYYFPYNRLPNTTAQGYFDLYNNGTILNMSNYNTATGYGGIYSTVQDMRVFIEAIFKYKKVLTPALYAEMIKWTMDDRDNSQFGLGVIREYIDREFKDGKYAYGHTGRDLGYSADCFYFPTKDITMTWLINYGADADSRLKPVILDFQKEVIDNL
jgi:D-alanyl-D-alanine carboxypeptidase